MPAVTASIESRSTPLGAPPRTSRSYLLAGSFNGRSPEATPMIKRESDERTAELELPPGVHEYRFAVDGRWTGEPECATHEGCQSRVPNPFGSKNERLRIE